MDLPLCRLRQIADTITRRQEIARFEQMALVQWQARQISTVVAAAAGVWADTSDLVATAQELSIFGEDEQDSWKPSVVRPRTGLEEWEDAAAAAQERGEAPGEMTGVPAGVRVDELPEMAGVPAGGPRQHGEGEIAVRGLGAQVGGAEALIGILEKGEPPRRG